MKNEFIKIISQMMDEMAETDIDIKIMSVNGKLVEKMNNISPLLTRECVSEELKSKYIENINKMREYLEEVEKDAITSK